MTESEEKLADKAQSAIAVLKKRGAMDLAEMLGLTPYLESEK